MANDSLSRDPSKVFRKIHIGGNYGKPANEYIGGTDDIWMDDENLNILRRGDGQTPGGVIIGGTYKTTTSYNELTNKPFIPNDVSQLADSQGLLTHTTVDLTNYYTKTEVDGLIPTTFSGNYNDLINKPTIPSFDGVATQQWVIDQEFLTSDSDSQTLQLNGTVLSITNGNSVDLAAIDTNVDLTNYYTKTEVDGLIPIVFLGDYNDLTNKPIIPTPFSGSYNDLTDTPTIPTVPTNVSAFTNDAGYITSAAVFSGDYNDLTNTPTIPDTTGLASEVYVDAAISNLVNGADAAFDTLKEIQDAMATDTELSTAINSLAIPTVPTNVSEFTNDAGYITVEDIATPDLTLYATIEYLQQEIEKMSRPYDLISTTKVEIKDQPHSQTVNIDPTCTHIQIINIGSDSVDTISYIFDDQTVYTKVAIPNPDEDPDDFTDDWLFVWDNGSGDLIPELPSDRKTLYFEGSNSNDQTPISESIMVKNVSSNNIINLISETISVSGNTNPGVASLSLNVLQWRY
jgi:hypothetical protein